MLELRPVFPSFPLALELPGKIPLADSLMLANKRSRRRRTRQEKRSD
jgi:hypothetical protein